MSYPTLRLHPRKEESVLRLHPWIFSGAIASFSAPVEDGDLVSVVDSKGRPLGTGHFGGGSIAVLSEGGRIEDDQVILALGHTL